VDHKLSDTVINFEPAPYTAMVELFAEGEVGIFVQGAGIWDWEYGPEGDHPLENRSGLIGYSPIPGSGSPGAPAFSTMADSYTYGISASCEIPEVAFEFLKEWNTAENLAHICALGGPVAPRIDALNTPEYASLPWRAEWTEQIQYAHLYPINEKYTEVSLLIQRLTERIALGTTVEEALQLYKQELVQTVGESNVEELP
jgi:maltose-binding protein MalE